MSTKWFSKRALSLLVCVCLLGTWFASSLKWPRLLGEEVRWDLSNGELKANTYIFGIRVHVREISTPTKMFFDIGLHPLNPESLLIWKRPLWQPRRGTGLATKTFSIANSLADFLERNGTNSVNRSNVWRLIQEEKPDDLYVIYAELIDKK